MPRGKSVSVCRSSGTDAESVWFGGNGQGSLVCFAESNPDALISDPRIDSGGRAVFRVDAGGLVEIARTGQGGITTLDAFGPAIDAAGNVVFRSRDAQGRALYVGDGSTLRRVIGQGDRVQTDLGLAQIGQNTAADEIFAGRPNVNAAGDVAFVAALHPDGNNQIEWGSGVFVATAVTDTLFRNGFEPGSAAAAAAR